MTGDNSIPPGAVRVLLVDDEKAFVSVLAKRLGKRGVAAETALSGPQAIEKFGREAFDLVLLDLKMEFMDGIETLKALKEMKPEVPVIMITGHGSLEEAQKGIECGAVACLPKPYDFEELVTQIQEICGVGEGGADG